MCVLDNPPCVIVVGDKGEGEGWEWGALVMVGVGSLQPLACAIFSRGLPCAGKADRTLVEAAYNFNTADLCKW